MQAPTDNLYKFIAISGLICLIFLNYDFGKRKDELSNEINKLRFELVDSNGQILAYEKRLDVLTKIMEKARASKQAKAIRVAENVLEDHLARFGDIIVAKEKRELSADILREKYEELENYRLIYAILSGLSGLAVYRGFYLWYVRTQKYMDLKEAIKPPRIKDKLPRRKS
jgi:site-specific recombinase XerC